MSPPSHHPHHPPPQQQPPQHHHPPPQQQPPQYHPYPPPKPTSKNLASCILATSFLTIILVAGLIACYILFHPQDPSISISTIKFTSYTLNNNNSSNTTTANFTFLQYNSVRNPNRYAFSHHGSSFQLLSTSSGPLGFIYIPAGVIDGGRTRFVTANFDVNSVPVGPGPTLEVETLMNLVGGVKVFNVFAHHVQKSVRCRVSVKVSDGSFLGYHC